MLIWRNKYKDNNYNVFFLNFMDMVEPRNPFFRHLWAPKNLALTLLYSFISRRVLNCSTNIQDIYLIYLLTHFTSGCLQPATRLIIICGLRLHFMDSITKDTIFYISNIISNTIIYRQISFKKQCQLSH